MTAPMRRMLRLAALAWALSLPAAAAPPGLIDPARGPVPIPAVTEPPRLGNAINDDVPRPRNYAKQPPTIPHRVDGYQVDKNFNKCLDCHARGKTEFSQAVPVSASHYIDRDGRTLAQISTRRYFCNQCHVAQEAVAPLVGNTFEPLAAITTQAAPRAEAEGKP
ncbi:MAG TPA: nitrate reductase cytochrome c-type subunit [Burkholderiaceae bacterium]|nr:nitrate reductase cytochrome c-type subunit [Burkholderiaceae bacterium]